MSTLLCPDCRERIRERLVTARARKRAGGGYVGGKVPYGYRVDGDRLVPDPSESSTVARIRQMRDLPLRQIAAQLDEMGVPSRSGRKWHPETIRRVLDAERGL